MAVAATREPVLEVTNNTQEISQNDVGRCFMLTYNCTLYTQKGEINPNFSPFDKRAYVMVESDFTIICQIEDKPCQRFYLVLPRWSHDRTKLDSVLNTGWCFQTGLHPPKPYDSASKPVSSVWAEDCVITSISEIPEISLPELARSTIHNPIDKSQD